MVVRGVATSPSPDKYLQPEVIGQSMISKSFGVPRDKCKSYLRGDKQADKVSPGPGSYLPDVIIGPKPSLNTRLDGRNSKSQIGFMTHQNDPKEYGRENRGSIFFNAGNKGNFPGP